MTGRKLNSENDRPVRERNLFYKNSIFKWIDRVLLRRGAYGIATIQIKIQSGIVQEISASFETKLSPVKLSERDVERLQLLEQLQPEESDDGKENERTPDQS